ncbi:hypothetical protein [Streptomyces sp. H39-S7]|uniref:hypothetical protein n=1 Tax=Streptomyces sp. H39-S7 TaxID=3004357 RepID=UPI0022AEC8AB|nr:hypothetical protein [Streptomyces sp. H39-S7]MCZ4122525.1 hypothetical protein [Streptomyces sp. H39-S7]
MTGRATPGRRTVLASAAGIPLVVGAGGLAALAGLATGCSGGTPAAADTPHPTPPAVPGAALRARAATDSTALLARYDGLIAARPELTARLAPLRAEVARHAQAFGAPAPKPAPAGTTVTTVPPTLGTLADAERRLADTRATALLDAPPELARLLASMAAAGAAHVILLTAKG